MNFTQEYLSPAPYHQGESFLAQRESCRVGKKKKKLALIFHTNTYVMLLRIKGEFMVNLYTVKVTFSEGPINARIMSPEWNRNDALQPWHRV